MAIGDGSPTSGGSGDVIDTEDVLGTGVQKIARGKLGIGNRDLDLGDIVPGGQIDSATHPGGPFPVHDHLNDPYWLQMVMALQAIQLQLSSMLDVQPRPVQANTGIPSSVPGSATSVQLLQPNTQRKGAVIVNDVSSTGNLYIFFASPPTNATSQIGGYTARIAPGGYYEVPQSYTGPIQGIWDSVTVPGFAQITELV